MMISVSIVVHDSAPRQLRKAIECIARSPLVGRIDVIDNGCGDTLAAEVAGLPLVSYRHVENRGYGAGHNIAIREAIASAIRYHLVINADVCWEGDVLTPIAEFMDTNPDVGLLSPKILYPDGVLQFACRRLPSPADLIFKRFLPSAWTRRRMERFLMMHADHDRAFNCPYLLGSFMFFRVSALQECGPFDERFFMYPEDIDITRRIHRKFKTIYWPEVTIVHEHNAASRRNLKMLRIHIVNMVKYFNKWGWWNDPERTRFNRTLEETMPRLPDGKILSGRG